MKENPTSALMSNHLPMTNKSVTRLQYHASTLRLRFAKAMGLKVSNELEVIDYLSKIKECQDFTLPGKRGRNRKIRNGAS